MTKMLYHKKMILISGKAELLEDICHKTKCTRCFRYRKLQPFLPLAKASFCRTNTAICSAHCFNRLAEKACFILLSKKGYFQKGLHSQRSFRLSSNERDICCKALHHSFSASVKAKTKENFVRAVHSKQLAKQSCISRTLSGEIFKENFHDIFHTNLEQIAFSLHFSALCSKKADRINSFSFVAHKAEKGKHLLSKSKTLCRKKALAAFRTLPSSLLLKQGFVRTGFRYAGFFPKVILPTLPKQSLLSAKKGRTATQTVVRRQIKQNVRAFTGTIPRRGGLRSLERESRKQFRNSCLALPSAKQGMSFVSTVKQSKGKLAKGGTKNEDTAHILFSAKRAQRKALSSCSYTSVSPIAPLSLNIKIGEYVNAGDKIGETEIQAKSSSSQKRLVEEGKRTSSRSICSVNTSLPLFSQKRGEKLFQKIPIVLAASGKIVKITESQINLQKTQPVLFYSDANLHVRNGDWVKRTSPILTLSHQTLMTGDIVQGIPRIEQLFEAFTSPPSNLKDTHNLHTTLHTQVREIFRKNWLQNRLPIAVRQSLESIQQILVESIQKVYLSQGVLIADKHIEIIVRQMSSRVEILDSGTTGFLLEEVINIRQIENANLTTPGRKALYAPTIVGLTEAALNSDSFISAASFQETTRVLSRDAVIGKSDFLRGLKEKVVIGDLISAGTGLEIYFVYTLLIDKIAI